MSKSGQRNCFESCLRKLISVHASIQVTIHEPERIRVYDVNRHMMPALLVYPPKKPETSLKVNQQQHPAVYSQHIMKAACVHAIDFVTLSRGKTGMAQPDNFLCEPSLRSLGFWVYK